ncbi:MAG: hypothetical protein CL761_05960 [Chloroflexi bacterium]|nr:hypothetical protein [Chloroflexota bacterium]
MKDREKYLNLGECFKIIPNSYGKPGNRTFIIEIFCNNHYIKLWLEKQQLALMFQDVKKFEEFNKNKFIENINLSKSKTQLEYKLIDFAIEYQSDEDYIDFYFVAVDNDDKTLAATFMYKNIQAQKTSQEALSIVSKGRPTCGLCFNPINLEGHFCIKLNGHIENVKIV